MDRGGINPFLGFRKGLNTMQVLITGIAGFLGSHLQDALIDKGHKVVGIDNMSGGFWRNINPKTTFYKDDLFDEKRVEEIFKKEKPEIVFHLAADATEGRSQFTPVSATRNNLMSSVNVFKNAIKYGVKRIIFSSSMSVYGGQTPPFDETLPTKPVDIYGVNKTATEKVLEILATVHNIEYVIFRPHNIFGPRQNIRDAYRNVIGIFMNRVMQGKPPIIYGDGEQVRSFSYIDNIIPVIVKMVDAPINGEIINIGPTETQSINLLAETVLKEFGSNLIPEHIPDRPREVKLAFCTVDKAQKLLGYSTLVPFEEGIKLMTKWVKELGPQPFVYLDNLEIKNESTPKTWTEKRL
jgi:UDP-glucose 4-epimerase